MNTKLGSAMALLAAALAGSCGGDDGGDDGGDSTEVVLESGSECEAESVLTYQSFGRDYFDTYCTRCHSSALVGAARNGAPAGANFDTLSSAKKVGPVTIDKKAVLHVSGGSPEMPITPPFPPSEEIAKLGVWLACGMP